MKPKFILKTNAVDDIYAAKGIIVPTTEGEGKAPAIKLINSNVGLTNASLTYQIYSDSEFSVSYVLNDEESEVLVPAHTIILDLNDLELNSSNTVEVTATNETGTTVHTYSFTMEYWTNWASADEILAGNKAISDGEEVIGTIETKTEEDITVEELKVTIPAGYYAEEVEVEVEVPVEEPDYLCFTAEEDNSTIAMTINDYNMPCIYWSTDKTNWTLWDYSEITLSSVGDKVYMYGENTNISTNDSEYNTFSMTGKIAASGDIQTLLTPELNYKGAPANCYCGLFEYCESLTTAPDLTATVIGANCYEYMFNGCSSLTTVPVISATNLAYNCCYAMFRDCTSLTTVPELLPATTLAEDCYYNMFENCTALTTAPELPATTLVEDCYTNMFNGCTSLNSIKIGATTWETDYASNWVQNVSATGDFYCPAGLEIAEGTSGIPTGWTRHDIQ